MFGTNYTVKCAGGHGDRHFLVLPCLAFDARLKLSDLMFLNVCILGVKILYYYKFLS